MMASRRMGLGAAILALCIAGPATAQENLDSGKSPAQLYASDCAICHKSPRGLSKAGGILGLQDFLREHYTASRQSAAMLAAYLDAVDRGAPPERAGATKRTQKPGEPKSAKSSKENETKLPQARPAQAEPKSGESKSAEPKPVEAKVDGAKADGAKPPADKPAADAKPAKPDKPD